MRYSHKQGEGIGALPAKGETVKSPGGGAVTSAQEGTGFSKEGLTARRGGGEGSILLVYKGLFLSEGTV